MKKIILFFAILISFNSFSQIVKDSVLSRRLDKYRRLSVSLPPSYNKDPQKTYPLILLLDGDYLLSPFQGAVSYGNYWDDLPEVIMIGLHQNEENERFEDCKTDAITGLPMGKGEKFFEFIAGELLPFIQTKYRISPFKIIGGHDVTGGFLNYFLYKDEPLFNGYISFSPEIATNMEINVPSRLNTMTTPIYYYLSSADGDLADMKEAIGYLDENNIAIKNPNLKYKYNEIKEASHYSLILHSIPNALYHIFGAYQPITTSEYQQKIVVMESGYSDYLKAKYDFLENTLGIKKPIRMNDFKAIEAAINKHNANSEYELLSQLANKYYPKAMLGEYYLAKYYEGMLDYKRAVKSYQNAYNMENIGDLTKDLMIKKADEARSNIR